MITVVRLGSPRSPNEGLRLGTVRRPPRGVPKADFAKRDVYDVWLPNLAPSEELLKQTQQALQSPSDGRSWKAFEHKYRSEMSRPDASRLLDLLAALSHQTSFSLDCADENRCHRSILRKLLTERGAELS
jgi:uncharacterized protein YeaO (DUF488 family)